MKKTLAISLLGLFSLGVALPSLGCGPAEAAPLDVTYYYLPG